MIPVITPEESARLDATSPIPVGDLMERAGLAVAVATAELGAGYGSKVAVLAGPGNNGGDGYVAAKYLRRRGCDVRVYALGYPKGDGGPARAAAVAAVAAGVPVEPIDGSAPNADFVIDALFGVGFRGELPPAAIPWIEADARFVAVDVPSGLDGADGSIGRHVFAADRTVTFGAPKVGHLVGSGPDVCGNLTIADIGLPPPRPEFLWCESTDAVRPHRHRSAHKWSAGAVLVVGGSPGITGAPLLAATAAQHFGAGTVAIACPGDLWPIYAGAAPGVMTRPIGSGARFGPDDVEEVLGAAARFDVIVLGPGLGPGQGDFVAGIVDRWHGKLLIDADGLTGLEGPDKITARLGVTILTPHAGEFASLTGSEASYQGAAELAEKTGAVVVLKGNPTFVAGTELWCVSTGGPELATIGTGDVQAGMIGALWAGGLVAESAARSATYWHGRAAADLSRRATVTAAELAGYVGKVMGE